MLNYLLKEYNCLGIPTGSTAPRLRWFGGNQIVAEDFKGLKFVSAVSPPPSLPVAAAAADHGGDISALEGHHDAARVGL
jgi:hypothetical protein